jgi:hypothetical protein
MSGFGRLAIKYESAGVGIKLGGGYHGSPNTSRLWQRYRICHGFEVFVAEYYSSALEQE